MADPAYQAAADQVGALQWLGLCWSQREGLGVRSGGAGEAARRCDIVRLDALAPDRRRGWSLLSSRPTPGCRRRC